MSVLQRSQPGQREFTVGRRQDLDCSPGGSLVGRRWAVSFWVVTATVHMGRHRRQWLVHVVVGGEVVSDPKPKSLGNTRSTKSLGGRDVLVQSAQSRLSKLGYLCGLERS